MQQSTTIKIDRRGGGPDFDRSSLFRVEVDGKEVTSYAHPAEVAALMRGIMLSMVGHDRANPESWQAAVKALEAL